LAKIVWLTGLSGAGKTTLCKKIKKKLKKNYKCLIIDGDSFRKKKKQFSFSKKSIIKNNLQIINYCKKIFNKYDYILVAVISPLKRTRKFAYRIFKDNYFEIFVFASLKTLISRDTKGLYELSKKGIMKNLIGYNSRIKYEISDHRYLKVNTNLLSSNQSMFKILNYIKLQK